MSETVVVGCKYPTGVLIQVGSTTHKSMVRIQAKSLAVTVLLMTYLKSYGMRG